MELVVNGKNTILTREITLSQFIKSKEFNPEVIVVEHNGKVAAKNEWENIVLQENDILEIISFVGGG